MYIYIYIIFELISIYIYIHIFISSSVSMFRHMSTYPRNHAIVGSVSLLDSLRAQVRGCKAYETVTDTVRCHVHGSGVGASEEPSTRDRQAAAAAATCRLRWRHLSERRRSAWCGAASPGRAGPRWSEHPAPGPAASTKHGRNVCFDPKHTWPPLVGWLCMERSRTGQPAISLQSVWYRGLATAASLCPAVQ